MTDEQSGLPPLTEPTEEDTLWVMTYTSTQADVLSPVDSSPRGCLVLSARGINGTPPVWGQIHLAIPHGAVTALRTHLDDYLETYPEDQ